MNREETIARALAPLAKDWLYVPSDFIIDVIGDVAKSGYPYNSTVQREVERRLGIPPQNDNGSPLSGMVYASQGVRHKRARDAQGWLSADDDTVRRLWFQGPAVEWLREGIMGESAKPMVLRKVSDGFGMFEPKARTRFIRPRPDHLIRPAKAVRP